MPSRPSTAARALLAAAVALAGCGRDDAAPAAPARERSPASERPAFPAVPAKPKRFETRSSDPVVAKIQAFIEERGIDVGAASWKTQVPEPIWPAFPPGRRYFWRLETNHGPMRFRLRPETAPKHVASTIYLTLLGFYDGTDFHRVITGFMAQGGDPTGTGAGGPRYQYPGEIDPDVHHDRRGLLSMANKGPGTDGSQFFVLFGPHPELDGRHTVFGELKDGEETLKAIEALGAPRDPMPPKGPVRLLHAEIETD
jgi:cyclophilin family peptidyl-prolyl cis-trans isomerase